MENDTLILEVSGEYGNFSEYQKWIAEAYLLGIRNVFFSFVWDRKIESGEKMLYQLIDMCQSIDMMPLSYGAGYCATIFEEPMIGMVDQNKNLNASYQWSEFSKYKGLKGTILDHSKVNKVLTKYNNI